MVNDHYTESLRFGRKLLAWAILLECLSLVELLPFPLPKEVSLLLETAYLTEVTFICYGIYKIGQYYQLSLIRRLIYALGSTLPFIGIFILIGVEKKSSNSLKREGYKVTLLGASRHLNS